VRTRLLLLLITAALSRAPLVSADDCASSCGMWSPYGGSYSGWVTQFCTPAAVLDTSTYNSVCSRISRVDVAHGTIEQLTGAGFGGCFFGITLDDDYRVEGLPAGTEVPLVFHLDLEAEVSGWNGGDAHVVLSSPVSGSESWTFGPIAGVPPDPTVRDTKSLSLAIAPRVGTPFRISIWIDAGAYGESGSSVRASYWFGGVPEGAAIFSCRGFVQGVVPTVPATWARVKASYR
jgi:hypothetical protein